MEWVNITAKSLPEAIDLALDNLGVDEAEAEIEVLEEPKQGLFGRTRGNARVKARVKPKETRPKTERGRNRRRRNEGGSGRGESRDRNRNRRSSGGGRGNDDRQDGGKSGAKAEKSEDSGSDNGAAESSNRSGGRNSSGKKQGNGGSNGKGRGNKQRQAEAPAKEVSVEEVSTHVESFLSGLVDAFGVDGAVRIDADGDDGIIGVVDGQHGLMVGPKGRTLESIQELARVSAQRSAPSSVRIKVDVGGYRQMRAEALANFAMKVAEEAKADGKERSLEPMNSADRKIVHDALNEVDGIETRSAGTDPRRRVVVVPTVEVEVDEADEDEVEDDEPMVEGEMAETDEVESEDAEGEELEAEVVAD